MLGIIRLCTDKGRSTETTGIESELEFDSITTGTGLKVTAPNMTTGASFMNLCSGSADTTRFQVGYDGRLYTAAKIQIATGGLTVTAGGVNVTGNAQFATGVSINKINHDVELGGSELRSGMSVFDLVPRWLNYLEDFTDNALGGSGTTCPWLFTQTTGTTSTFVRVDADPLGIYALASASCSTTRSQATVQHVNEFIKITNNKRYYFEARVAVVQKLGPGSFFIGLTNADTDLFNGVRSAPDCTDFIGFSKFPGSLKWDFVVGTAAASDKHSATSSPGVHTGTTGTFVRLGFSVDTTGTGTTVVSPYVNGVAATALTEMTSAAGTSTPSNTALTISAGVSCGAAGGNRLELDYVNVICQR